MGLEPKPRELGRRAIAPMELRAGVTMVGKWVKEGFEPQCRGLVESSAVASKSVVNLV
jgi:hypothetical protein